MFYSIQNDMSCDLNILSSAIPVAHYVFTCTHTCKGNNKIDIRLFSIIITLISYCFSVYMYTLSYSQPNTISTHTGSKVEWEEKEQNNPINRNTCIV